MQKQSPVQPIQIRCLECSDGALMNRIPGNYRYAKYRCAKEHVRQLPKQGSVQWNNPNNAA